MSEIKGQLLGIIIVLMVFAAVGGAMVTIFKGFATTVSENVDEVADNNITYATYEESASSVTPGGESSNP